MNVGKTFAVLLQTPYWRATAVFERMSHVNKNGGHCRVLRYVCSWFHIYKDVWRPVIGEELRCQREEGNSRDPYVVAITKSRSGVVEEEVVGHVPHYVFINTLLFIRRSGEVYCIVTGIRRHSRDLPQGGMEIPCKYHFIGNGKDLKKIRSYISNHPAKEMLSSTTDNLSSSVPEIKQENETSCSVFAQNHDDLQCTGSSISHSRKSTQDTISSDVFSSNDPVSKVVNSNHKVASVSVIDKIHDSSVMSGMNALEKILTVTDNDSDQEESTDTVSSPWVSCGKHTLNISDKIVVESANELTDKHIQMAQYLIKCQFPLVGGLQNTLKQQQLMIGCTADTMQVIHCNRRKHWIIASTKGCPAGVVNVYDTIFDKLDHESRGIIKRIFSVKDSTKITMVPIQKQKGIKDCGVFTIAIMTSLAYDEDPCYVQAR